MGKVLNQGADMALAEYKSTSKYGHNKMHYRAQPDVPRLSIGEKLYERRFVEGKTMFDQMLLDFKLDVLVAEFVRELDALTKAGGYIAALDTLTGNEQAAVNCAFKHADSEIKYYGGNGMTGFRIVDDLQLRAQKLLGDHPRLIKFQCAKKWWVSPY